MEPNKLFLFVIDTTENQFANIGRGILNTQLIYAKDKVTAKEIFVKIYRPHILQQIQYCTHIYDISEIETNLKVLDPTKTTPMFSHLPLQGGRPPKPEPLIPDKNVEQIGQIQVPQIQQPTQPQIPTVSQQIPVQQRVVQQQRPLKPGELTQDQMNLIKAVGAIPVPQGENAGFNTRVNASVGVDGYVPKNMFQKPSENQSMSQEQLNLLRGAGVSLSDLHMNIEFEQSEIPPLMIHQQAELGSVTETPLTNEQIAALQSQI